MQLDNWGAMKQKHLDLALLIEARITTAISELARNIYLYASIGVIEIERIETDSEKKIVVVATDQGPGIKDVRKVMEDGYSTSGG